MVLLASMFTDWKEHLTQLHAVTGVSILEELSTISKEHIPVSTKVSVGKNGWNQIRSRGIHRAPLARQGEGALSPLLSSLVP